METLYAKALITEKNEMQVACKHKMDGPQNSLAFDAETICYDVE